VVGKRIEIGVWVLFVILISLVGSGAVTMAP
jgi:hypothetical protein